MDTTSPASDEPDSKRSALQTLWKLVSSELSRRLGVAEFDRWFSPVNLVRLEQDALWLSAPNTIYSLWIEENYLNELREAISLHLPKHPPIRFEVKAPSENALAPVLAARETPSLDAVELFISPQSDSKTAHQSPRKTKTVSDNEEPADRRKWITTGRAAGLSDAYQFDNFVVGAANRLANAAARAVAEKPGRTYHPLFIHSASGLGKTHLLHAIGWDTLRRRPRSKVVYISAERFANEYIEAIQKHTLVAFRKRYREADMLLIDDIQFLSGKEGMQEEFFHTFNSLTDRHKQIVLASDRPATEIREIEDRLVSRFQWGMTAEIAAPTMETRIAILRRKRDERGAHVPDWILNYIANHVTTNVRAMEGALIRAATLASMNEGEHALDEQSLGELLVGFTDAENARQVSIHEIQEIVADHFEVTIRDLTGRSRTSRLVEARHMAMTIAREKTDLSLSEIGKAFGGRDHGTVINACKKITAKTTTNPAAKRTLEFLRRALISTGSSRSRSGYNQRDRDR